MPQSCIIMKIIGNKLSKKKYIFSCNFLITHPNHFIQDPNPMF